MKPISYRAKLSSGLLQQAALNDRSIVASIKGSVKKLGAAYQNATVALYNKENLSPIAIRKPDANGNYQFLGLNTDLTCFIVAFDNTQQYNAVIQDMVVPK